MKQDWKSNLQQTIWEQNFNPGIFKTFQTQCSNTFFCGFFLAATQL